ncbi:MAG: hypothetical protein ACREBK_07930 [Sphingomicrobium sp.]
MRTGTGTVLALCGLAAGCGEAKTGFDDSFNKSFHEKFISSCVSSATQASAPQDMAAKLCTCASDKIKERFSVRQKMSLRNEQILPIVEECRGSSS